MQTRSTFRPILAFAFLLGCTVALQAAVPNRIVGAVSDSAMMARPGTIHPQAKRALDQGRLNGTTALPGLSLNFVPSAAQQAALDALLTAQQDPASASYHQWLTPEQFGEQFGMSAADLGKVTAWLQTHGFTVERSAPSRNAVHFSGTVEQVEQAFHTELHTLTLDGEVHFANMTEPSLPAAFANTVGAIGGLSDFRPKPHVQASSTLVPYAANGRRTGVQAAAVPFTTDGSGNQFISPSDFAKIYDVKALYDAGFSGSMSYPIAVVGQTAVRSADITDFRTAFGLSATNLPTNVLVPNTGSSAINSTGDLGESELDLEWSGAVAPSAPIYFIYTGNSATNGNFNYGVFDALQYVIQTYKVSGKSIPIISISYGECEPADTAANYAVYESWFKQANAQGQTILSASGDQGAAGCDYTTTAANGYAATQGLATDYPSSSVYVTGVGGTTLSADSTSPSTYWAASNDSTYGNSLGLYIPSTSWNNTPTSANAQTFKGLAASGGGVSVLWAKPSWQIGIPGNPSDGKRDVPDVSLAADPNHDGYLVCINLGCEGSNASFNIYGGTSVGAPAFAGILALTEQKLAVAQGNLNPALYSLSTNAATYASSFHDITTGSNIVPCIVSATNTGCTGGSMGYSATIGYDLVTGLGDVDAANLAAALGGVPPRILTMTTLAYTPTAPVAGQAVTFTATIAHSTGTAVPSGTVVFTLDGGTPGTTVTVGASGTATFTSTLTTGGSHTISAVYSGDASYYGSTATATINVTVPASGTATTTTLSATPASVAVGSRITLVATVSSAAAGSITGSVTFKTSSGATLGPVNLVSGSSGTTATLSVPVSLASFALGTNTVTATYAGSASYGVSTSQAATVTVTNPTIALSATNISVSSGGSGSSTITITAGGNYAGTVGLTASSASTLKGSYSFTPATVTLVANGTGTSVFTLTSITGSATAGSGLVNLKSGLASLAVGGGLSFAGLFLFGLGAGAHRRRMTTLLTALVFTALASGLGCGSSSSSAIPVSGTTGTYTVTITGTDTTNSSITGNTTFTVTIR